MRKFQPSKLPYDVDKWTPDRLTYVNGFLRFVIGINVPSLLYSVYSIISYFFSSRSVNVSTYLLLTLITLYVLSAGALIGIAMRYKSAAKFYMVLAIILLIVCLISEMYFSAVLQMFHVAVMALALKSVWKPVFIPSALKAKLDTKKTETND